MTNIQFTSITCQCCGVESTFEKVDRIDANKTPMFIDSIIDSVNGSVRMKTVPENLSVNLVNGDIRLTLNDEKLRRLKANTVNGDVKIALPLKQGLEGTATSSLGKIHNRLTDFEVVREKNERMNQLLQFRRVNDEMATIELTSTTGNIYLKNNEETI